MIPNVCKPIVLLCAGKNKWLDVLEAKLQQSSIKIHFYERDSVILSREVDI